MPATRDYIDYLNEHIEMAPASSEEEYQAAQCIESLMSQHGLETEIQEFETPSGGDLGRKLVLIVLFVGAILAGIVGTPASLVGIALVVFAFLLTALAQTGHDVLGRMGPRVASQNVIGVHRASGPLVQKGNRKIVIVAHYDTPHENFLYNAPLGKWLPLFRRTSWYLAIVVAVLSLLQAVPFIPVAARHVLWVLAVIVALPLLLLGAGAVYERISPSTTGAVDNKSSVAALLGVVDQVRPGSDDAQEWATAHRQELESLHSAREGRSQRSPRDEDARDAGLGQDYEDATTYEDADEDGAYDTGDAAPDADASDADVYAHGEAAEGDVLPVADELAAGEGLAEAGLPVDETDGLAEDAQDGYEADADAASPEEEQPSLEDYWYGDDSEYDDEADDLDDGEPMGFSLAGLLRKFRLPFDQEEDESYEPEPAFGDDEVDALAEMGLQADLSPDFGDDVDAASGYVDDELVDGGDEAELDEDEDDEVADVAADVSSVVPSVEALPVIGPDGTIVSAEGAALTDDLEEPFQLDPDGLEVPYTMRRGPEVLLSLKVLPETCELVYRDLSPRSEVLARAAADSVEEEYNPYLADDVDELEGFEDEYEESSELLGRMRMAGARAVQGVRNFFRDLRVRMGGSMDATNEYEALEDEAMLDEADFADMAWIDDEQASSVRVVSRTSRTADDASAEEGEATLYDDEEPLEDADMEDGDEADEAERAYEADEAEQTDEDGSLFAEDLVDGTELSDEEEFIASEFGDVEDEEGDVFDAADAAVAEGDQSEAESADAARVEVVAAERSGAAVSVASVVEGEAQSEALASEEVAGEVPGSQDAADELPATVAAQVSVGEDAPESVVGTVEAPASADLAEEAPEERTDPDATVLQSADEIRSLLFSSEGEVEEEELASKDISGLSMVVGDDVDYVAPAADESARPAEVDDPSWGTSDFRPRVRGVAKRASLRDLPDPSREDQPSSPTADELALARRRARLSSIPSPLDEAPETPAPQASVTERADEVHEPSEAQPSAARGRAQGDRVPSKSRSRHGKSKQASRRLGFGRREEQPQEESLSDWLGIGDDYDAKKDGRAIGSWDNFDDNNTTWKGGASLRSDLRDEYAEQYAEEVEAPAEMVDGDDTDMIIDVETQEELREAILRMGDELASHDIWFVALGASAYDHAGMREFLEKYRTKVRGSFVINLDSVGAGHLTMLTREGPTAKRRSDRRLGRLLTRIADDLHIALDHLEYVWDETDATLAVNKTLRATTIMGLSDDYLPALSHTIDDAPENVDGAQVVNVTHLVTELIRRS